MGNKEFLESIKGFFDSLAQDFLRIGKAFNAAFRRSLIDFKSQEDILNRIAMELENQLVDWHEKYFINDRHTIESLRDAGFKFNVNNPVEHENYRVTILSIDPSQKHVNRNIFRFDALEDLYLSGCNRKLITHEIASFKNLAILKLDNMKLRDLPLCICDIESLQVLNLDDNRLETLPEEISKLKSVHYISLRRNNIERLPESLLELPNLKTLLIDSNVFFKDANRRIISKLIGINVVLI